MTIFDEVKTILGDDYKETNKTQLEAVIRNCEQQVLSVTRHKTLPAKFEPFVVTASVMTWRRLGEEGMISRSAIGISTTYQDVTDYLQKSLRLRKNGGSIGGKGL